MTQIWGHGSELGWIAVKASLLFVTAVLGFRAAGRRTLSQMTGYDFVAVVAVGAVVGRVPNSTTTSFLEGVATLGAVFATHVLITRTRQVIGLHRVVDHPPWLVIADGAVDETVLRRAGLTRDDLAAQLRRSGVSSARDVRFGVLEATGALSVLPVGSADDSTGGPVPRAWAVERPG
jgi:uncharacterized membrane protein YcaP (DUF421 family)